MAISNSPHKAGRSGGFDVCCGQEDHTKTATPITPSLELTDAGNAERFVALHDVDVRYVPKWGWLCWTGTHWRRDNLKPRELMMQTARQIHTEAAEESDIKRQRDITAHARKSQQAPQIRAALWLAQPYIVAQTEEFDRKPWLLPVVNGTLDLRTAKLHPHLREHKLTRFSPVCYDAAAVAPRWMAFLHRVLPDAEVRAFVQRFAGYALTGLTSEQCLAFLYGSGRNGKSVFVEMLAALLGNYHTATRIDTLSLTRSGGIPNDVAALAGARLVTASETPEGMRLNESLVKDLTGGDTISARFMRSEYFQFQPQFKLIIRGNHKPHIRGTDDGIWRRLILIPFTVQIPANEVDASLPKQLQDELPGILRWATQGCLEWQRIGLQPPRILQDAMAEYRSEMDLIGVFIDNRCFLASETYTQASALYTAYRDWCGVSGHHPVSQTLFGTTLSERGFVRRKIGTIRWLGIGIRDTRDTLDPSAGSTDSRAYDLGNVEKGSKVSLASTSRSCKV